MTAKKKAQTSKFKPQTSNLQIIATGKNQFFSFYDQPYLTAINL